jgi:hypothetical protein
VDEFFVTRGEGGALLLVLEVQPEFSRDRAALERFLADVRARVGTMAAGVSASVQSSLKEDDPSAYDRLQVGAFVRRAEQTVREGREAPLPPEQRPTAGRLVSHGILCEAREGDTLNGIIAKFYTGS